MPQRHCRQLCRLIQIGMWKRLYMRALSDKGSSTIQLADSALSSLNRPCDGGVPIDRS